MALDFQSFSVKLKGCNAMVAFLLQCTKDTGSQFGATHNLDASSVSSNIPWIPKFPAECLLVTHAYFMKSEAD